PSLRAAISSSDGGCTVSSTSARASAVRASAATSTSLKAASGKLALSPAPRSSTRPAPLALSFLATSGVSATRRSPGMVSRTRLIVIAMNPSRSCDRPAPMLTEVGNARQLVSFLSRRDVGNAEQALGAPAARVGARPTNIQIAQYQTYFFTHGL